MQHSWQNLPAFTTRTINCTFTKNSHHELYISFKHISIHKKSHTCTHQMVLSLSGNCAHFHKGGWWYNACGQSNLNGVWYSGGVYRSKFQDGIFWADYGGGFYSMKSVRIMIRPIDWRKAAIDQIKFIIQPKYDWKKSALWPSGNKMGIQLYDCISKPEALVCLLCKDYKNIRYITCFINFYCCFKNTI